MRYLIIVDMQQDFVYGCLGSEAAAAIVDKMADTIEAFDGKVIFTRDTHGPDYLETAEGKKLPVAHCLENTPGWEIIDRLKPYAEDVVNKPTFGSVSLAERLYKESLSTPIEEIVLAGVCTSICVISNALLLKAFMPETPIKVRGDLCACVSPQSHEAALTAMETAQIEIVR